MRRLLASDLLPKRAGQPVKALVHIYFAELLELDGDSALQDTWIEEYRARWAAHRAAASVATGDGGAWLEGDAARKVACDAMAVPVVTGDVDPAAMEDLIAFCVRYHSIRARDPAADQDGAVIPAGLTGSAARRARQATMVADTLAELEHQILGKVLQVVSGPGGVASFLRRNLLGKGLNGPSLPLDVGQPWFAFCTCDLGHRLEPVRRTAAYPCANQPAGTERGSRRKGTLVMKLSWRRPRLLLSALVAVGALSGLTVAAAPAYAAAPAPRISAANPAPYCDGIVTAFGYNFQPGDLVRIELLSGDLRTLMDTQYSFVNIYGEIPDTLYTTFKLHLTPGYHGSVWVVADEYEPGNQTTWTGLSQAC